MQWFLRLHLLFENEKKMSFVPLLSSSQIHPSSDCGHHQTILFRENMQYHYASPFFEWMPSWRGRKKKFCYAHTQSRLLIATSLNFTLKQVILICTYFFHAARTFLIEKKSLVCTVHTHKVVFDCHISNKAIPLFFFLLTIEYAEHSGNPFFFIGTKIPL